MQLGQKQYEYVKEELKVNKLNIDNLNGIKIVPYIYEIQETMDASEIVTSRAGAITVTEIANLGKPSILIPLPNVSHNHQQYNAEVLEKAGAAKIIRNEELNANVLHKQISEMLEKNKLEEMSRCAKELSIENVEDKIYEQIKKQIKR